MVTQVQQLTRGRSALESSARITVCRSTQVMQGNEILTPTMASMRLHNPVNNANPVGGFGGIPGPVPFNVSATMPYNPEVRIQHPVYPQMPTHSPMEIENAPSFPSFCAGMTTPVSSAYITPTMQNSPPPPPVSQLQGMLFSSYLDRLQRFSLNILFLDLELEPSPPALALHLPPTFSAGGFLVRFAILAATIAHRSEEYTIRACRVSQRVP
jgi:hypothetical protein